MRPIDYNIFQCPLSLASWKWNFTLAMTVLRRKAVREIAARRTCRLGAVPKRMFALSRDKRFRQLAMRRLSVGGNRARFFIILDYARPLSRKPVFSLSSIRESCRKRANGDGESSSFKLQNIPIASIVDHPIRLRLMLEITMALTATLPIGLFDSGVGGLTVFKAVSELLPNETLLYLGDTARVPYGVKSKDTIIKYTLGAAKKLMERNIKILVVACNTATSAALPILREYLSPMPVIGVIEPGAESAVKASENGHIAVIGTEATIRDQAYQKAIARLNPEAKVIGRACTLFVPLAEEGWTTGQITDQICQKYLGDIFSSENAPDTLLLGCTHFPLLIPALRKVAGEKTRIVDSATAAAARVKDALGALCLLASEKIGPDKFYTTDNPERFIRTGKLFLDERLDSAELVDILY